MTTTIKLPELGENVVSGELTKILVSAGDTVSKDQALLELETEKATIEVPSPVAGTIKELHVQKGHTVKVGDLLFTVEESGEPAKQQQKPEKEEHVQEPPGAEEATPEAARPAAAKPEGRPEANRPEANRKDRQVSPVAAQEKRTEPQSTTPSKPRPSPAETRPEPSPELKPQLRAEQWEARQVEGQPLRTEVPAEAEREETVIPFRAEAPEQARRPSHLAAASPSIRRLARELGVDINKVSGTGPEGRIDEEDVKNYAREIISRAAGPRSPAETFAGLPDFSKWGQIERKPMTSVRRSIAEHLAQAWQNVPQVTQFDSADITDLELLRSRFADRQSAGMAKITVTAIALKIAAAAIEKFPQFAASIDMANREIVYKHYCNIGVAVDTSLGLLVPVVRDVERKNISKLASELSELSEKARGKKLSLEDMAGGVFTITNLGGVGGTGFSPIVNYPEVAILGISRLSTEPRHIDGAFQPRKILPLSLSYDHRLIDGADAARFLRWVAEALEQPALLLF